MLLRMVDYDTSEYEKTRKALKGTQALSKPETVERLKQEHLRAKRPFLSKLLELRAAPGKAQSGQLRTASAVIKMTSDDAAKVVDKMMTTMTKATDKMAKLKRKHDKLMVQQADASDRVDTVADYVEAGDTIDVGEQTGADDNGLTEDDIVAQLEAVMDAQQKDANAANEERPSSGAGSSTDRIPPVAAPKAEAKAPEAKAPEAEAVTACPVCTTKFKGKRGLASHKRHCLGPGEERQCDTAAEAGDGETGAKKKRRRRRRRRSDDEAADTIVGGEQSDADDEQTGADAADVEHPPSGAGSSTDMIRPALAPAAAPAGGDTEKVVCPDCGKVQKNERGLK